MSLCLLAQAYELGSALVSQFADIPVTVGFLMQIDKLVQLIESPIFIRNFSLLSCLKQSSELRLQLLDPHRYPFLLKVLYGLLMLLPQSTAFNSLRVRLQSVSALGLLQSVPTRYESDSGVFLSVCSKYVKSKTPDELGNTLDLQALLTQFVNVQARQRAHESSSKSEDKYLSGGSVE